MQAEEITGEGVAFAINGSFLKSRCLKRWESDACRTGIRVLSQRLRRRSLGLRQRTLVDAVIVTWRLVWTGTSDGTPAILDHLDL